VADRYPAVYKIPPLKVNEGHRANDWGDLAQPLWKGRMRILEKSAGVSILFEDASTGMIPCIVAEICTAGIVR
jgi:adaptin ear-binding coat-associated protein 1/2